MCSVNQPKQEITLTVTKHSTRTACVYSQDAGVLYAANRVFLFRLSSLPIGGTTPLGINIPLRAISLGLSVPGVTVFSVRVLIIMCCVHMFLPLLPVWAFGDLP